MNLPLKWLKDFVDVNIPVKEIADAMTMSGSKVETVEYIGEGIENVVVGKVLSVERHQNSDHLYICMVDVGKAPLQIVTGASNVTAGALVPVALDGSTLPGGVHIKKGKLRGALSEGMLCSIKELGLTLNNCPYAVEDGILILQEGTPGEDIRKVLGLDEYVIEFEITPNRPDCLSVIGLAREAAATFDLPFKKPVIAKIEGTGDINDYLTVEVKEPELCLRYAARVVKNVKIAPSPKWMRERLHAAGIRPINNIVDITNYVMLEYGQPMHAFDYSCLTGKNITVRRAKGGEPMTTLDGKARTLTSNMLVIADAVRPVAVAGVMGGENSEIKDTTNTVVFESANFFGPSVRLTSKALGLRTDSSARFEKGLDPENVIPALERACELVSELCAGEVVGGIIDVYPNPVKTRYIELDSEKINRFLGTDLAEAEMVNFLARLEIVKENGKLRIPSWRADIECMADIAEEVVRLYGYNKIPTTIFKGEAMIGHLSREQKLCELMHETLRGFGCDEILTYTFISPKYYDKIMLPADSPLRKSVTILNPLGEDTSIMRTTALPSMLEILSNNYSSRNESASLYEIATVFIPKLKGDGSVDPDTLPDEYKKIMLGQYGESADFYALKGIIEGFFDRLNIQDVSFRPVSDNPTFHPGRCAAIYAKDALLGVMGEVHPKVRDNYQLEVPAYAAELDFAAVISAMDGERSFSPLPKFPAVSRDLALVCDIDLPVAHIAQSIKRSAGSLLESLELFDVYTGKQVGEGKKSVAYSIVLRSADHTLADSEVEAVMSKIIKNLAADTGAQLRT